MHAGTSHAQAPRSATAREQITRGDILIIGHRGDSKVAPENSLPAFISAMKAGADMVELDYQHSADGVPIVIHDEILDRTTNALAKWGGEKIAVAGKSASELVTLDAGSWFDPKFAGTSLVTLDQALDTIQNGCTTVIERKSGDAATCVELLRSKGLLDKVIVQAFDWDYLAECHRLAPNLVLCALGENELTEEKFTAIKKTGASAVGWNVKHTTAPMIAKIHQHGLKAWVWTADEPEQIEMLVAGKIDAIITNKPAATRALVAKLGKE